MLTAGIAGIAVTGITFLRGRTVVLLYYDFRRRVLHHNGELVAKMHPESGHHFLHYVRGKPRWQSYWIDGGMVAANLKLRGVVSQDL
jgi:hypothetical protein